VVALKAKKPALDMADDLDAEKHAILSGLTRVGPAKPIGYLPLYTICDVPWMDPQAVAREAEANGRSVVLFGPDQCSIKSGGLYIFDRQSLETLLQSSRSILSANCWPLEPDQFVARIAREWVDQSHSVASVIRRAFGDQAN
jgi:hypothetical protein